MIENINGMEIEFRDVPARTPRITGYNGRRKIPARVEFGPPGEYLFHCEPTMERARTRAVELVAIWQADQ